MKEKLPHNTSVRDADLLDLTKMGFAICTVKIMPESPEVDMQALKEKSIAIVREFVGDSEIRESIEPVAFGLNAIKIIYVFNEKLGNPDVVPEKLAELEFVNSAEIVDVRRAIG